MRLPGDIKVLSYQSPFSVALVRDSFHNLVDKVNNGVGVGLYGPKGAGKSTTLLLYACYLNENEHDLIYISSQNIFHWSQRGELFFYFNFFF